MARQNIDTSAGGAQKTIWTRAKGENSARIVKHTGVLAHERSGNPYEKVSWARAMTSELTACANRGGLEQSRT